MSAGEWQPARFASYFRVQPGEPPIDRWEAVLRAESSVTFRLVTALARSRRIGRLIGLPPDLGGTSGTTLADREERVTRVGGTRLAQGLGRIDRAFSDTPAPIEQHPGALPRVGPALDREINRALAVTSSMSFEEIQTRGWHLQPNFFYWPLNDLGFLRRNPKLWAESKQPADIDWDLDGQTRLTEQLASYSGELADVRDGPPARLGQFAWNQGFSGLDAYLYYGLARHLQPSRVVEVGIGMSSVLLARAVAVNDHPSDVTLIDPAPRWAMLGELPADWEVIPSLVQNVDLDVFSRLGPGDLLFYDGSHCAHTGSDVNWLLFEVLPRLSPGVWIHFHDIFWPRDYWEDWIFDEGLSWNEQYFVQAFLMNNPAYRVRLAAKMLRAYKASLVDDWFAGDTSAAGSAWVEKVA